MPRDGAATRTRLLDAAEGLVLERGLAGTSLEDVLAAARSSKGAFFHHFASKADLGRALVERWAAADAARLDDALTAAHGSARDQTERLLAVIDRLEEGAGALPGSLFAAFLHERGTLDDETRAAIAEAMLRWRAAIATLIAAAAFARRPRSPIDPVALADQLVVTIEGALVVARALDDPALVGRQVRQYREQLVLLFEARAPGPERL